MGKFFGSIGKHEYRCTTTNLPLCNDIIIVLTITVLLIAFPLSQSLSFESVTNKEKLKLESNMHHLRGNAIPSGTTELFCLKSVSLMDS